MIKRGLYMRKERLRREILARMNHKEDKND